MTLMGPAKNTLVKTQRSTTLLYNSDLVVVQEK